MTTELNPIEEHQQRYAKAIRAAALSDENQNQNHFLNHFHIP